MSMPLRAHGDWGNVVLRGRKAGFAHSFAAATGPAGAGPLPTNTTPTQLASASAVVAKLRTSVRKASPSVCDLPHCSSAL